jgi:hypothetical protein
MGMDTGMGMVMGMGMGIIEVTTIRGMNIMPTIKIKAQYQVHHVTRFVKTWNC